MCTQSRSGLLDLPTVWSHVAETAPRQSPRNPGLGVGSCLGRGNGFEVRVIKVVVIRGVKVHTQMPLDRFLWQVQLAEELFIVCLACTWPPVGYNPFSVLLAWIIHKWSTAAPDASILTTLHSVGRLDVVHDYACGVLGRAPCQNGAFIASSRKLMNYPG